MTFRVTAFDDAGAVLDLAGGFLADRPVENNLVLSLLGARAGDASESATSEPGHYWVATGDSGGADVVRRPGQSGIQFGIPACRLSGGDRDSQLRICPVSGKLRTA